MASTTAIANITAGTCVLPPGPLAVGPRRPGRPLPLRHECSQWHVVSAGEICAQVAAQYDTNVAGLHTLNPSLASEYKLKTGYAYCAAPCDESSPWITISTSKASNFAGSPYRKFMGTGTAAQGWPQMEDWDNYEKMAVAARDSLETACAYWQVQENTPQENDLLLGLIPQIAAEGGLEPRVALGIALQESHGCLRVPGTIGSHPNPGIFQSHSGTGTCNTNVITPGDPGPMPDPSLVFADCPAEQVAAMVRDGLLGTGTGDGIKQLMQKEKEQGYCGAQMWYRVARGYNSGHVDPSGALELGGATAAYVSDLSNRLTGWHTGNSRFK